MTGTEVRPSPVRTIGRYALHSEIASGGMATVYFGRLLGPVGFSRTVAIKRLHPHFAKEADFVSMFLDEARLAARIVHPNVVQTVDIVVTDGELFVVMDYAPGESLARIFSKLDERRERVPLDIACAIMANVLHGLHAAHEAKNERGEPLGIIHRDVSPANVLVGTDGVARLLDFGVSKAVGRLHTTREGSLKGKIAYMAPEQIEGNVSRQSDIYAASVVFWELITGQRLFKGEEVALIAKVLGGVIPPPSTIATDLPEALDALVLRGLARQPEQRFSTAREMALALEACAELSPPSKIGEWVSRIAADALAGRNAQLAAIESMPGTPEVPKGTNPLAHFENETSGVTGRSSNFDSRSGNAQTESSAIVEQGLAIDRSVARPRKKMVLALVALTAAALGAAALVLKGPPPSAATGPLPSATAIAAPPIDAEGAPVASAAVPSSVTAPSSPSVEVERERDASPPSRTAPTKPTNAAKPRQVGRASPRNPSLGEAIDSRQ